MNTKHLDNEIERLNLMERTKDLSDYGQDMLNEFRAIKQALNLHNVRLCLSCKKREGHFTKRFNTTLCDGCYDKTLNEA